MRRTAFATWRHERWPSATPSHPLATLMMPLFQPLLRSPLPAELPTARSEVEGVLAE